MIFKKRKKKKSVAIHFLTEQIHPPPSLKLILQFSQIAVFKRYKNIQGATYPVSFCLVTGQNE